VYFFGSLIGLLRANSENCDGASKLEHYRHIFTGSLAPYNLNIIMRSGSGRSETMGVFILGLIVGAVGALLFFIYDEGELFLKLSRQIKQTADRYKQSS
jgi:hypothetical protein